MLECPLQFSVGVDQFLEMFIGRFEIGHSQLDQPKATIA